MKAFKIFSTAALALMIAACSSDDIAQNNSPAQQQKGRKVQFTATIAAPNSGAGTRTEYSEVTSGDAAGTINVAWKANDEIALIHNGKKDVVKIETVNEDGSATITGTITVGTDGEKVEVCYPAALWEWNETASAAIRNSTFTANIIAQDGTLKYIQDKLDVRMGEGKLKVSGDKATLSANVTLASQIAIWKLNLQDNVTPTPAALKATQVIVKVGDPTATVARTATLSSAASTIYLGLDLLNSEKVTIEATVGDDTYKYEKESVSIARGKYYQSTVTMAKVIMYSFKVTNLAGDDQTNAVTSLKMSKAAAGVPAFCTMNDDERCVFFEAPASWGSQINVWAWMNGGDGKDYLGTNWPGVTATKLGTADNGNSVWKWNVSGSVNPDNIIFNDGSKQTANLKFTNGGYYVGTEGLKATVTPEYEAEVSGGKITIKAENLSGITAAADFWFEAKIGGKPYVAKVNIDPTALIPETPITLAMATLGDVILSDGTFAARSSTGTNVAMIAYLGSETGVAGYTHGLALALTDKGQMSWTDATGASGAAAHIPNAPTSVTSSWMLPSRDQWNKMIDACKDVLGNKNTYEDLRDGFNGISGASNLQSGYYWSSTETEGYPGVWVSVFAQVPFRWSMYRKNDDNALVRAILAF